MMQPLDKNTLFSIFEAGDEQVYKENGVEDVLNNPFVLMGMVLQGIQNYHIMDMMYQRSYPEQYKNVAAGVKLKYYNKLYSYLNRINSNSFETIYTIGESFDVEEVYSALDHLRLYFEGIEEYEKCGIIKKFIDFLKENVGKLDKIS